MKEYEIYSNLKVSQCSKLLIRLDGRNFHSLSNDLNLKKPYDKSFAKAMIEVSKDIFNEFSPSFVYTFSDEINILLSEIPFSGRIEKLDSIFPSFASSSLITKLIKEFNINEINFSNNNENKEYQKYQMMMNIGAPINSEISNEKNSFKINIRKPLAFDSRIIPIIDSDIFKYFKWRQDEAWRNFINGYGIWALKEKYPVEVVPEKIFGLKSADIHDLVYEAGINLNDLPSWQRRGIAIYKNIKTIKGYNPKEKKEEISYRKYSFIDCNLPKFNNEFFIKKQII